jgi:hypothetical protein
LPELSPAPELLPVRGITISKGERMRSHTAAVLVFLLALGAGTAHAQDAERDLGWMFSAEFSGVWTGGNQETFTLGLDGTVEYVWPRSLVRFRGGAVTTESSLKTRTAVGTGQDDFVLQEATVTEKTAEAYYARGLYEYDVSGRFYLFGGVDWLRNTFSGIDSRFLIAAGAGNTWKNTDEFRFRTGYSLTYTFQEDVVKNPFIKTNFPGLRLDYDWFWKLTASTDLESILIADFNLDNTDDIRLDWYNALPISISSKLAFKPSLRLLWRNEPSLTAVPLFDAGGNETGTTVLAPLEKLDSFLTIALVVTL